MVFDPLNSHTLFLQNIQFSRVSEYWMFCLLVFAAFFYCLANWGIAWFCRNFHRPYRHGRSVLSVVLRSSLPSILYGGGLHPNILGYICLETDAVLYSLLYFYSYPLVLTFVIKTDHFSIDHLCTILFNLKIPTVSQQKCRTNVTALCFPSRYSQFNPFSTAI